MCSKNRERRIKFLSLTMQHAHGFRYVLELLAEKDPELRDYRCQEGHTLIHTVLPQIARSLFNAFGSNFAKDVTSEARELLSCSEKRKRAHGGSQPKASSINKEEYKKRKLTSAYKS